MKDPNSTIKTLGWCCIILSMSTSALGDFVGITSVIKDDPDTEFLCTQGNGDWVPGPLTVCNVFTVFDNPADRLLSVGFAELQVYNGANPDVFFQHPLNPSMIAPTCFFIEFVAPDLICDTFVTIGYECGPDPAGSDGTAPDGDWDDREFNNNGHIIGGWWNGIPSNGQGDAGNYPDLEVLILQSSVAPGLSLSGVIDVFWRDGETDEVVATQNVPIECAAACGSCPTDSDGDGDTDAADLAVLLGNWGICGPAAHCECLDNDASGSIDMFDLAVLLGAWGPCR